MAEMKRICVIGAGAAGMACAYSLAQCQDRYDVTVMDSRAQAGGMAMSTRLADGREINEGVQGCSNSYRNTMQLFGVCGHVPEEVKLRVSFGQAAHAWNNREESALTRRLSPEIARFGRVLQWVHRLEPLSVLVPIGVLLRVLGFSAEFRERMLYPLTALFFGTGNQTPHVSAAIVARVFLDPDLRLFEYDPARLLSEQPDMFAFPRLGRIYADLQQRLQERGVHFLLRHRAVRVERHGHLSRVSFLDEAASRAPPESERWRGSAPPQHPQADAAPPAGASEREFDHVVFACDAESALRLLSPHASTWMQRMCLRNVRYYDDVTVTHCDEQYMRDHYEFSPQDMYFIHTLESDPSRLEMSFRLTSYQPWLLAGSDSAHQATEAGEREQGGEDALERDARVGAASGQGGSSGSSSGSGGGHIFQSIFLDASQRSEWSLDAIRPSHRLLTHWWRQFAHTWTHFVSVVPLVRFIQGARGSFFCGAWTLINTHEIAIISGLAVAHRLGAPYPFDSDPLAAQQFDLYLEKVHGVSRIPTHSYFWSLCVVLVSVLLLIVTLILY
eukprot:TRINITY_DN11513_c0_g1_i1.p1 TRINITY_DN11513_c0_g1~~TRINITY_DN11513_c0_g1_i1.p1  ORF type:complete len:558 (-),score=142.62 TRINITY_DN11513_c0_g1_i1:152-1825(-)